MSQRNRQGRGRGRGAGNFNFRKKNEEATSPPENKVHNEYTPIPSGDKDIKNEAALIVKKNSNKPPVTLKKFLSNWIQTKRRNVEVKLNPQFSRNIVADWITMSATFFKNYYEHNDFNKVSHYFEALLYSGIAQKLILSNPKSEYPKLGVFANIQNMEFFLPPKFITVIETIGKSEEAHLRTKIMYNSTWIKRMIFNAVRHGILADPERGWIKEKEFNPKDRKYYNVVFPDEDSLRYIKDSAKSWLQKVSEFQFNATVGDDNDIEIVVRVPKFPDSKEEVIKWYKNIVKSKIFDNNADLANALTFTVVTYMMDIRYLLRPKDSLKDFDDIYEGTLLADMSSMTILANCGWTHISDLCSEQDLYRNFGILTEEINESWIPLIRKVVKLEKFNGNKFGSMGLISKVDNKWFKEKKNIVGKNLKLPSSNVEGTSIYQTEAYDGVAINLMYGLVEDTSYMDNYVIKADQPIESIRSNFINTDFVDFHM